MAKNYGKKVLVSSFSIWQTNQRSNSSDDLLVEFFRQCASDPVSSEELVVNISQNPVYGLRQLPVNVPVAAEMAIAKIERLQPDIIFVCGMAMSRTKLSVESQAVVGETTLYATLDLAALTQDLVTTEISHDAGKFVCNGLYFTLLNYLQKQHKKTACLFVHVPILTPQNRSQIVSDFRVLLERVQQTELV